jgi:2-isopropylmalate synthase
MQIEAIVKLRVNGKVQLTVAEGDGPVNALDGALRRALEEAYPSLRQVHLEDYKVRVLASGDGTAAKVRVLIESSDGKDVWGTVGVSENLIEASWVALVDSLSYKLLKDGLVEADRSAQRATGASGATRV